ncbi:AsmA family protein [Mucilaginibacter sp. HMF5004]|nr:AsmA family protein [Mucilaginibacter rivuli]
MPKWLKISLKVLSLFILIVILVIGGVFIYISSNKANVLALVSKKLNHNLNGKLTIADIQPSVFTNFPDVSLSLRNVTLRDSKYPEHHHTLLDAKIMNVSVNMLALLKGTVSINHIDISNAAIDLYTDTSGYSNTAVFKKGSKKAKVDDGDSGGPSAQLHKFSLTNVTVIIDDDHKQKLFSYDVYQLNGIIDYHGDNWHAELGLNLLSKSMAFKTENGSFLKNKTVTGNLIADYDGKAERINVKGSNFEIGSIPFDLEAKFAVSKKTSEFMINVGAKQILWRDASSLLAANITPTINKFNFDRPINVKATISGSFGGGSPYLHVEAIMRNNRLSIPGGVINDCSFNGVFTNNRDSRKGNTDSNSVIHLFHLTGKYSNLPFSIDTGSIVNFAKPYATGNFVSHFPIANLNTLMGGKVVKFGSGIADIRLKYKADIVDYRINKPAIAGTINLKNANINYVSRGLQLTNSSLSLNFLRNDLILKNIRVQSGRSIVLMEGKVNNFLNLYYNSPEKIVLNWQVTSPQLYLGEFLGFLNSRKNIKPKTANSGNIIDQLYNVLDKGKANMHIRVDKVYYNKFLATNATADILLSEDGFVLNNVSVKHAGGSLKLNAQVINQVDNQNKFILSTIISNVDVHEFFYAFNNFGLTSLTSDNLKGFLSAKAQIKGGLSDKGVMKPNSVNGYATINLKNASLINFKPINGIGKFAFPFRNLDNISIPNLDAKFDMRGDKVIINPMKISSSVLNIDVAGTYSFTTGTNIAIDVPLRNPKKDSTITDKDELAKKRYKGIVLHLVAKDGDNGRIKIGLR